MIFTALKHFSLAYCHKKAMDATDKSVTPTLLYQILNLNRSLDHTCWNFKSRFFPKFLMTESG